jgi:hypothetical protein
MQTVPHGRGKTYSISEEGNILWSFSGEFQFGSRHGHGEEVRREGKSEESSFHSVFVVSYFGKLCISYVRNVGERRAQVKMHSSHFLLWSKRCFFLVQNDRCAMDSVWCRDAAAS